MTPTSKHTVQQMFGHTIVYTACRGHKDNELICFCDVQFNFGSMFIYVPQSARLCAYLCGSVLFEFSLSDAVC